MQVDTFQSRSLVEKLTAEIARLAPTDRTYKIMHVCGSHEHSLSQWGLRSLLPQTVELIAGPGCPVCVCPEHEIREAIAIADQGALVVTYGDMLRVPTRAGSLLDASTRGADVKLVYSAFDAARVARENPDRQVCFFAVGFETTAAPTAALALADPPANLSILTAHRLTPPAMMLLLQSGEIKIDALIAPGHVSVVIGADAWVDFPSTFGLPTVVAGFEPVDLLLGVQAILKQASEGVAELQAGGQGGGQPPGAGGAGAGLPSRAGLVARIGRTARQRAGVARLDGRVGRSGAVWRAARARRWGAAGGLSVQSGDARPDHPGRVRAVPHRLSSDAAAWAVHGLTRRYLLHLASVWWQCGVGTPGPRRPSPPGPLSHCGERGSAIGR